MQGKLTGSVKDLFRWLTEDVNTGVSIIAGLLTAILSLFGFLFTLRKEFNSFKEGQDTKRQIKTLEIDLERQKTQNLILATELVRVQASLTPRGTLVRSLEALSLLSYAGTEVEIASIDSKEAQDFVWELAAFLTGSRWKLDLQTVMTPPKLPMAGRSGTLIFTNAASSQHVKDALEALVSKLIAVGIEVPGMHELSRGKQDIITVEIKSREEFRPAP